MNEPRRITERQELLDLMTELHIPGDWHEPDQADITAAVHGLNLDNAGFWPLSEVGRPYGVDQDEAPLMGIPDRRPTLPHAELHVTLLHEGRPVAAVNLASLFAWATGMCGHVSPEACRADPATGGRAHG